MKLLIIDAAEKSFVGSTWALGAVLFGRHFDLVVRAKTAREACEAVSQRDWEEVQVWGHGRSGAPEIGGERLLADHPCWDRCGTVWFRSCSVFEGAGGLRFAEEFSRRGVNVVAHTRVIGHFGFQPGLYGLRAGFRPYWPARPADRSPFGPRAISAARMNIPDWAWGREFGEPLDEEAPPVLG